MKLGFGPHAESLDWRRLFQDTDAWVEARWFLDEFKMYAGMPLAQAARPNDWDAVVASGALGRLRAWGVKLVLEAPALKAWRSGGDFTDPYGERVRDDMRRAVAAVREANGEVFAIAMDEPFTAAVEGKFPKDGLLRYDETFTASLVANFIREARAEGVASYLIEPYPHFTSAMFDRILRALASRGELPSRLVLDIDPGGWGTPPWYYRFFPWVKHGLDRADVQRDLLRIVDVAHGLGLEVEIILIGDTSWTQAGYAHAHQRLSDTLRTFLDGRVDRIMVQNWYRPHHNLPEAEPTSHTGLLRRAARDWRCGRPVRDPIPAPRSPVTLLPRLLVDGRRWRTVDGPWTWRGATAFPLIMMLSAGQDARVEHIMAWLAARGITLLRTLTTARHLFPLDPAIGATYLPALCELASRYRMYVEPVVWADTATPRGPGERDDREQPWFDLDVHALSIGAICHVYTNTVPELANEPDHETQAFLVHDPAWLMSQAQRFIPDGVPYALGAAHGPDDESRAYIGGTHVTVHGDRNPGNNDSDRGWRAVRHLNELRALSQDVNKPVENDEWTKDVSNPAKHLAAGLLCAVFDLGDTIHLQSLLEGRIPTGADLAAFDARVRGWQGVPADWRGGRYINAGDNPSGTPVKSFRGAVRMYSCVRDDIDVGYTLGLGIMENEFQAEWGNHWTPELVLSDPEVKLWRVRR